MLLHIKPNRKKSRDGSLSAKEKLLVKGLLNSGYSAQDIVHIVNQGRLSTINLARITEVKKNSHIKSAAEADIRHYIKVQSAYDPKTLLNPYLDERLIKAREAMLAAVQIFNSPTTIFKTEIFCVLSNIAWTYLLHEKMEQTTKGSSLLENGKSITLGGTLNKSDCPIKNDAVKENLVKIIEIRDAVEHTFFSKTDECFGALFQATCLNFERFLTEWFGFHLSMSKDLSLALQFAKLKKEQIVELEASELPEKIKSINLSIQQNPHANDDAFQLNVYFTTEVSSKTSSDLHKLVTYTDGTNAQSVAIKKQSYTKLSQAEVVARVKAKGYKSFSDYVHFNFWKSKWPNKAKRNKDALNFGEVVLKNQWQWYEQTWLPVVLKYCEDSGDKFT